MARCQNFSLGGVGNELYSFDCTKYAIMYRFIMKEHCEIIPDNTISETLAESLYPRDDYSNCSCCVCRQYLSIIPVPCTIDSSDSLFDISSQWSDESFIQIDDDVTAVASEQQRENTNHESIPSFISDHTEMELPRDNADHNASLSLFSDSGSIVDSLSTVADLPLADQSSYMSRYDDFDSQWQSESEDTFQFSADHSPSFSDAETQCPVNSSLTEQTFSNAETQDPSDMQKTPIPFLGFISFQSMTSDSSDCDSHSERLLKPRK